MERTVQDRLHLLEQWVQSEIHTQQDGLLTAVNLVAAMPDVAQTLADDDADRLKNIILPHIERLRAATGHSSLFFHFHLPPAVSFLRTWNVTKRGDDLSSYRHMVVRTNEEHFSHAGLEIGHGGPALRAVAPIILEGKHLGSVEAATSLIEILQNLGLPQDYGLSLLLDTSFKDLWTLSPVLPAANQYMILKSIGSADTDLADRIVQSGVQRGSVGSIHFIRVPLRDFNGGVVGEMALSYNATATSQADFARVSQFILLTAFGSLAMWTVLYMNVQRLKRFLDRLKKILIASQSNDFAERFESVHTHCLEVLHCGKEDCPVHQNPSLVCYLETGSKAISPTWRNTCKFIKTYLTCDECPVYKLRRGDELMDIKNVINTLMRTWGLFLGRVGTLLSEVLRNQNQSPDLPSLDQVSGYLEQMAQLTAFSHDLQGVHSREEVYRQLAFVFERHFGIRRYSLMEVSHSDNRMLPVLQQEACAVPISQEVLLNSELCRARRVAEEVCSYPNPVLCPYFNIDHESHVRCCLPMVMGGRVGAVFSFIVTREEWAVMRKELVMLRRYLDETAPIMSSLRLLEASKEQSLRDPLTHCHNRRFLDSYISHFEALSKREGKKAALLMADLDYFKQVNDQHGHEAGDIVLQQMVSIMKDTIRSSDLLIRYGGEEFLVLLLNTDVEAACEVAEKIRRSIEEHTFSLPGGIKLRKTISFGVAVYPDQGNSMYKVLKFADVALYSAKNNGRNRVVRFTPEMWTEQEY